MKPVVVKVGGSLYDLPDLGPRLRSFLATLDAPVLIVPGGGAAADVVRSLDRVHGLGDEASHWLALQACSLNTQFLTAALWPHVFTRVRSKRAHTLVDIPVVACSNETRFIVDLLKFGRADERRPDHCPHRWDVTSDSLAVRVAHVAGAEELLLLKSVTIEGNDWSAAAARGDVDGFFPVVLARSPGVRVRAINFRGEATT